MDTNNKQNKVWKQVKILETYDEASAFAESYRQGSGYDERLLVKIRRCGPGGTRFKIKVWHPDYVKPKNNKKRKK